MPGPLRLTPMPKPTRIPLSLTQQRLWMLDQIHDGSATYNNIYAIRFKGSLDATAMAAALTAISGRHDVLRTCFPSVDGEPWQHISPPEPIRLHQEDLSALPEPERATAERNVLSQQQSTTFDLETGPLARYVLLRMAADEHVLVIVMPHIICDSTSFVVLYAELGKFYSVLAAGQALDAEPLALQYADYALWQRAMADSGRWDGQLRFWREHLKDAPPMVRLSADRPRPAGLPGQGASYKFSAGEALTAALLRLGASVGVTPFMLLFAAFGLLLGRYQGGDGGDVVIGMPIDGRFDRRLGALIGMFINTLAVRVRYSPDATFRELLGDVRETLMEAYGNADAPFDWVVRDVAPRRNADSNPLINVMFQLQYTGEALDDIGELTASWVPPAYLPARFDISLDVFLSDGRLSGEITYATALLSESAATRIAEEYIELLDAVAASPDRPVSALGFASGSAVTDVDR
jgi:hypothetical protein